MLNPFKKRQQKKAAAAAAQSNLSRSPPTDYAAYSSQSDLPPRAGIFISSAPALPRSSSFGKQHGSAAASPSAKAKGKARAGPSSPPLLTSSHQQQQSQQQSLDHVLPPTSDFRQSLIMPHLTRRFTLLRAPDGSLVSPDAMRAHLRAQRARARAANLAHGPSNQIHFLTEDEENEIIEQLKAQARQEGRDFDVERSATANGLDSWRSGGTDGFGLWDATPASNGTKLSTLADAFGDFTVVPEYPPSAPGAIPPAWSPTNKTGGSSFTGRSAERDQAYIRTVQRERDHSKSGEPLPSLTSESEPASSRNTTTATSTSDSRHHSQDTAESVPDGVKDRTMSNGLDEDAPAETSPTVEQGKTGAASQNFLNVPGIDHASRPRTSQDPNLLTTLSPEAFKRVSTALDEVFGLIASEQGPASSARARSAAGSNHGLQRSSIDSDTISFTSAVSNVRGLDARRTGSDHASSNQHETGSRHYDDEAADPSVNGARPNLDAVHIEQGRLALHSPLPGPIPGALPNDRNGVISNTPDAGTKPESLVPSESVQTIRGVDRDGHASQAGSSLPSQVANDQHLSVSDQLLADSTPTLPSDRTSTATARDALPPVSRIVSTASTIDAPRLDRTAVANQVGQTATGSAIEHLSDSDQRSQNGSMLPPATVPSSQARSMRPDRTPEMTTSAFFASPAQSTLSRGDSVVSGHSVRSSLTGPSGFYQGTHSRKSSADKLALARSMAPHPHLREQPSLSSVRRNYRQHTRSTTGSSEGSLLGGPASRRSSGAMSPPPLLSRSARSPSYFPPPSSGASMHDYASGFKPPSAISPAAAAALQSMTGQANYGAQPTPSSVMDASNALRSAQNVRNSASTGRSIASPQVSSLAAFTLGSDRAAATSSPETGATSTSLHHRNASLNSAKQQSQRLSQRISTAEDGAVSIPSKAATIPELQSIAAQPPTVENGLMPIPPADPEQAERWRSMYGTKAVDAASIGASAEDVTADPNDDEDLWAKMASASDAKKSERPVSNFPPSVAEERLAGSGITFDQIANFQNRLIQTANGGEAVPPLPVPRIQAETGDHDYQQQKFADAKSKGLASPNLVFDSEPKWSKSAVSGPTASSRTFAGINGKSIITDRDAPMRRSMSSSVTQDPPVSPRAVMYDVTTSHRPTSPPLHSRNGSLSGLPSLLELNAAHRESFSLSQAVEQASRQPSHKPFESPSIAEEPSASHDSQYAVATSPVQQHPFNVGYTSPPLPLAELYRGNSFSPGGVGDSPRHQVQTTLPEDVWDRYGPQQGDITPDLFDNSMSPDTSYLGAADPSRLLDDVAAQTSAATRALKGTDDGTTPTPPFRTKSISRKKSFKKVSKQISSPQLISTTQKLDHATQIPPTVDKTYPSTKSPSSVRSHVKASPSRTSQMGSFGKSFHRRRSSSFGHDAAPDESFGTPGSEGQSSTDRAPGVHPNHPYMSGGANSGSLSRLFSKINRRKNDQAYGGATIEPFPPELSAAVRASELASQQAKQPQQQQQPVTPEMPSLPPIERSTPWTLPRMPSSASSTERTSSVRSPTSPVYTLPIDSTLMPRNKSKKRTPIVLKRESEVILPGDPGYIPTAVIGRSPEQRAKELAEEQQGEQHGKAGGRVQQEQSTDTTLEKSSASERVDEGRNTVTLAAPAAAAAVDAGEAEMPVPAPVVSAAPVERKLVQEEEPIKTAAADTLPSSPAELAPPQPRSTDARKSLRDTIVRRTIIVPSGFDLSGDNRRSLNVPSSRKSRRFAAASTDEPVPLSGNASKSFDVDSPALATRLAPPPLGETESREEEGLMSTSASNATLHPRSNRASGVGSDYAASLYDMYINGEPDSPTSDRAPAARHIEVTERADGSVVWQVIAGLADRGSVYSELDARQSRHWSDTGSAPAVGGSFDQDQYLAGPGAGLHEEERSFFTRPRPSKEVFDLQTQEQPTRIVYHTDAQLASLLDVLAKGKDSAKFEFQLDPTHASNDEWQGSPLVDGNDIEAHRNRVEAEIFTLLNRRVVEGDA